MRDLGIADRLRQAGLLVEEQPGWQQRGSSNFEPFLSLRRRALEPAMVPPWFGSEYTPTEHAAAQTLPRLIAHATGTT